MEVYLLLFWLLTQKSTFDIFGLLSPYGSNFEIVLYWLLDLRVYFLLIGSFYFYFIF